MNDLLKKLNVLVKSTLHDALGEDSEHKPLPRIKLGKGIDHEVDQLRERINEALSFEEQLQSRVQTLQAEVDKWDKEADDAVKTGIDAHARYAVGQMQRAQQRITIAQSDLHEHQLVTQELIMRVNTLDAAVADARRSENESAAQTEPASSGTNLSDALRDVREKISRTTSSIQNTVPQMPAEPPVEDKIVEDDLARRRQRLSKPE